MQVKKTPGDIPIRYIKGVGPKRAEIFSKLGIYSLADLFYYLPRRYEDRSKIIEVKDIRPGETQAVIGKVLKVSTFRARTGTGIVEMAIGDARNRVFAVWYNMPFMGKVFKPDQTVVLFGKVERYKRLQINHPDYELLDGTLADSLDVGRIVPVYSLTENLSQRYIRKIVHGAIKEHSRDLADIIPTPVRARHKLVDIKFAVENIHFPHSQDNLERAYHRLVFEEFLILQVIMALKRKRLVRNGVKHDVREGLRDDFERLFPFQFTADQKKCLSDIENDMSSGKPMYRLLQGDVGSGKTVVAMYALLLAASGGRQTALMAPTEILARQHYVNISQAFMPLGLNVRLLVNGLPEEDSNKIKDEINKGEADIVIGTHALIQQKVDFKNLALAVVDEQHKFGVEQRDSLRKKGSTPDMLFMTATPIPRSLVLTVFGDMDISYLKSKPVDREPVTTYWVGEDRRQKVYDFLKDQVNDGRQAFIVYPRIKSTGVSDLRSVEEMFDHLDKDVFPDLKLGMIHGQMKASEKDEIMKDLRSKRYDILVSTTVVEVGLDIPNASVMVVEHAERYGLSQLHQLRGRIGRGKYASYCILMGEPQTESSQERLSTMTETDDGFQIAEKDLDIRGPGEFLGTRQSGIPELRFGNIARDFAIMEEARKEAFELVSSDPELMDPHNRYIKRSIAERFGGKVKI